ncbi:uncharacterized protein A1O5_07918 [Cladophialophora psammophila CBS 110553]|uniref:Nephrocystin 3-like N-terminal domain-containing protein n=1 Tax=Cladophialophora psammophila CBS 110553 TaxID=1182543 RepID=W9WM80_9EURO|nr:uncharacterized protein A1O5_07918 [Cladophialophora psammophila CBS 110553]EXJ68983.1 hypothetical protein A1O5_07918 [Cladophialophora psammophila CBS 110553]
MLDPLSAIGLASAIVQFVDFSAEIIQGAREVYGSMSGTTERNRSLELVVSEMINLTSKLSSTHYSQQSEDEKALGRVANECKILADQVLDLLQKIKAKDPGSTLQALWAALKNQKYKRQRLELEGRLESCRNNLEFQLNFLTSVGTKGRLDALLTSAEGLTGKLEILHKHVEQLRRGTRVTSISPEAQEQLRELLHFTEEDLQKIKQQRVLESLAYADMDTRFEHVSEEHSKTFEWIFGDTTQVGSLNRDTSSKESFLHWLSAGSGIFHISGKLGSGKSTLMKFLCNHPRTETELQHWAGGRKLTFAKFFFWKGSKTVEQKSLIGLVRSLLYETLNACPELIPDVLPDLWAQLKSTPWQVKTKIDLRKLQTRAAMSSLISHRNLYREHCFCFFIDGLDEFEKTPEAGYADLTKLLCSWSEAAPDDVKICVSSREDLVFMSAFSSERRFRLQDLTREDIQSYVRDKLPRADGIFLWVALVVKSIRDQLDENYEVSDVEKELDQLPTELHELFEYLLKSFSSPGRKRAHRTFAMVLKLKDFPVNLSLLGYSFLRDYENDPTFAMETCFPCSDMDDATRRRREYLARIGLYRDCRQFLESQAVQAEMKCSLDSFSTEDAISQLFLAELRCNKGRITNDKLGLVVYALIKMRIQDNIDQEPYRFQESLSATVIHHQGADILEKHINDTITMQLEAAGAVVVKLTNFSASTTLNERSITSPLHISAFCGACEYVAWKIERDPTIIENTFEIAILACCIEWRWETDSEYQRNRIKLLELMLARGLSPNTVIHTCPANNGFTAELSFWQHFLVLKMIHVLHGESEKDFGEMIERFLEYDADPHVWVSMLQDSGGVSTSQEVFMKVTLGRERRTTFEVDAGYVDWKTSPPFAPLGKEVSLRELIEFFDFDNAKTILQLLDGNAEGQERMANVDNAARDHLPGDQQDCMKQDLAVPDPQPERQLTPQLTLEEAEKEPLVLKPSTPKGSSSWLESRAQIPLLSFVLGILVAFILPQLWAMIVTHSRTREP